MSLPAVRVGAESPTTGAIVLRRYRERDGRLTVVVTQGDPVVQIEPDLFAQIVADCDPLLQIEPAGPDAGGPILHIGNPGCLPIASYHLAVTPDGTVIARRIDVSHIPDCTVARPAAHGAARHPRCLLRRKENHHR